MSRATAWIDLNKALIFQRAWHVLAFARSRYRMQTQILRKTNKLRWSWLVNDDNCVLQRTLNCSWSGRLALSSFGTPFTSLTLKSTLRLLWIIWNEFGRRNVLGRPNAGAPRWWQVAGDVITINSVTVAGKCMWLWQYSSVTAATCRKWTILNGISTS
jgi:hypothetical protein